MMKRTYLLLVGFLSGYFLIAQHADLAKKLYNSYEKYKAGFITHRRFKHKEVMQFLEELKDPLKVNRIGGSIAGKDIRMVSYGSGGETVLLWSQMHGNEPTATMALMDIFNFLGETNDEFDAIRATIVSNLSVYFIPMLNPDGADKFVRRNNQGIDINRDALRLQTPEGQALKEVRDSLNADWGFNLHDQGRTSYISDKSAAISVLAPAFDEEKSVNEKRGNAMQLIALMNEGFQRYIPGQVSQYSDEFEPRAFGDNIQKWGTRTILIESGGLLNDREKQELRKLNFMAILIALYGIATNAYDQFSVEDYFEIPLTNRGYRDMIIKNIQLPESMGGYLADVAFNFIEVENDARTDYYLRPNLVDIGDLSTSGAYLTYDANSYAVMPGKLYQGNLSSLEEIRAADLQGLLKEGITDIVVDSEPSIEDRNSIPMNLVTGPPAPLSRLRLGSNRSLLFYKRDALEYVLVNGYFFSPHQDWKDILKGMKSR